MENTFISYLLLFCLTLLLIMYLNQNMKTQFNKHINHLPNHPNHPNLPNLQNHLNLPIHHKNSNILMHSNNKHNDNNYVNTNPFDTCKNGRTSGMPVHPTGPAINFHQHFTKYTTNPSYIAVNTCGNPTGIPELGWRNMYLSNFSKNQIPDEDSFSGIPTRNYLDNMENVDNIYRKCL